MKNILFNLFFIVWTVLPTYCAEKAGLSSHCQCEPLVGRNARRIIIKYSIQNQRLSQSIPGCNKQVLELENIINEHENSISDATCFIAFMSRFYPYYPTNAKIKSLVLELTDNQNILEQRKEKWLARIDRLNKEMGDNSKIIYDIQQQYRTAKRPMFSQEYPPLDKFSEEYQSHVYFYRKKYFNEMIKLKVIKITQAKQQAKQKEVKLPAKKSFWSCFVCHKQ